MKVLSNLMGNGSKIKYTEVAIQKDNNNMNIKEYVDGVVESGSNTNGNYIKFSNGIMICTKQITGSVTATIWAGNTYYYDLTGGSWAATFTSINNIQVSNLTKQFWCTISDSTNSSVGTIRLIRPDGAANQQYNVQIYAIGFWKQKGE